MLTYPNQEAVSTRDLAWNTLGTAENLANETMTAAEALERSGLANWNVRKVPVVTGLSQHASAEDDMGLVIPDQYAVLADIARLNAERPTPLGIVGSRFKTFQNEEVTDLLDAIVDEGGANLEAMGWLNGGRKTFGVLRMPEGLLIGGEDAHDTYLGFTNGHDGSASLRLFAFEIRLACTNMLTSVWKGAKQRWTLRHTASIGGRVGEARRSLELTFAHREEFKVMAERDLLGQSYTDREFARLVDTLEPASTSEHDGWVARQEERRNTLRYLFNEAPTNEFGRGTKWAAYNAFTEYADWHMPVKGDDDGSKRAERTLDSATVANFKQNALDALLVPA